MGHYELKGNPEIPRSDAIEIVSADRPDDIAWVHEIRVHGIKYNASLEKAAEDTIICIEGIDGCGKSSTAEALKNLYERKGYRAAVVHSLGAGPFGKKVRDIIVNREIKLDPRTEISLIRAMHIQLQKDVIGPLLDAGVIVILDRGLLTALVYHGYVHEGMTGDHRENATARFNMVFDELFSKNMGMDAAAEPHSLRPSAYVVLQVDRDTRMARRDTPLDALDHEVRENPDIYEQGFQAALTYLNLRESTARASGEVPECDRSPVLHRIHGDRFTPEEIAVLIYAGNYHLG